MYKLLASVNQRQ